MGHRVNSKLNLFCIVVITMAAVPTATLAETLTLPSDQSNWLNSAPLSMDAVKGKGAVLWFFEEG